MAEFQYPQLNPTGPLPAPNASARGDRPAVRAGRELSAYGDKDYPETLKSKERRQTSDALNADASKVGNAAYGNMRQTEANPSDSAQFESFDPSV